tara:strand:+ start:3422 stop:4219 length:798 start_codon:yes stop_codon:yes gene_type:complete
MATSEVCITIDDDDSLVLKNLEGEEVIKKLKTQELGLIYIRDALSFYHQNLRWWHDLYNKLIIGISIFTTAFESIKTEFRWEEENVVFITRASILLPILTTTSIALISAWMQYQKHVDKMEDTTKSIEKCHYAINKQRIAVESLEIGTKDSSDNEINYLELKKILEPGAKSFREALSMSEMLWLSKVNPVIKKKYLNLSDDIHRIFEEADNEKTSKSKKDQHLDQEIIKLIKHSFKADSHDKKYWFSPLCNLCLKSKDDENSSSK